MHLRAARNVSERVEKVSGWVVALWRCSVIVSTEGVIAPSWQGQAQLDWLPKDCDPVWTIFANRMPAGMQPKNII